MPVPGEMDPARKPLKAALPDEVLQHETERRKLDERRGLPVRPQQVDRLARSAGDCRGIDEVAKASTRRSSNPRPGRRRHPAVRRARCSAANAKREALPAILQRRFARRLRRPCSRASVRRRVRAIVCDDEDAHAFAKRRFERLQGLADHFRFIVSRDDDDGRSVRRRVPLSRPAGTQPKKNLDREKGGQNRKGRKQDGHQHGHGRCPIFILVGNPVACGRFRLGLAFPYTSGHTHVRRVGTSFCF